MDDEEADEEYESDLNGTTQQPQSDSISGNLNDNGKENDSISISDKFT